MKFTPDLIEHENTFETYQIKLATKHLLERNPKTDGILFASDWQAYAGMQYLKENKIQIPDDISIIAFDDLQFNEFIEPKLSSIRQPMYEIGEKAMILLNEMIKSQKVIRKNIVLGSKLIIRDTTRKI